jgi:hypothetical protein
MHSRSITMNASIRNRISTATAAAALLAALALAPSAGAMTSHAGWPSDQHLVMDKGPAGQEHTLSGVDGVHNYLLGGYGSDTIYTPATARTTSTRTTPSTTSGPARTRKRSCTRTRTQA